MCFPVQFDSNGDGQISLTELREAMKKLMGEQVTNREINEILRDVDLNGDGLVNFEGERTPEPLTSDPEEHTFPLSHTFSRLRRVCADDVSLTGARRPALQQHTEVLMSGLLSTAQIIRFSFFIYGKKEKTSGA